MDCGLFVTFQCNYRIYSGQINYVQYLLICIKIYYYLVSFLTGEFDDYLFRLLF